MVELRKRPAPTTSTAPPAKKKAASKPKAEKAAAPVKQNGKAAVAEVSKKASTGSPPKQGETIDLDGFGGEVETNDGKKVTLAKLVSDSKAGVVLFTYPKASTPGCTTQACLFRDSYEPLTATGLAIYGLSTDSPKSNTTFKTKHSFPYTLLCDPDATLIQAIGLKKAPKSTTRGIFVVAKDGKVLAAEPGSPSGTVEVVKKLVDSFGGDAKSKGLQKAEKTAAEGDSKATEDAKAAETAAQVADSAEKLDGGS